MLNCKTILLHCAAKILITVAALLILSACSTLNAQAPQQPVCRLAQPEAALMQSRQNGQLTIGLQRLDAAIDAQINAQAITAGQLIQAYQAASTRLAELGDQSNATLIALQEWANLAIKRCSQ